MIFITTLLLVGSLFIYRSVLAAVTLVYFRASSQTGMVLLTWETATELDNAGFFINRSSSQYSGYSHIGNFIPARGDPLLGATYQYTDRDVTNGITYWYKLETIDIQQSSALLEPPVSAIPGGTLTPTVSATATRTQVPGSTTATRTPTATRTTRTGSLSGTPTQAGSNPYPAPSIPAQQTDLSTLSPQISETLSITGITSGTTTMVFTGTATLIPFPTITLEFPYPAVGVIPTPPSRISPGISWFTPMRLLLILFVIFVWVFLGGWYYFSLRRME